MGNWSKGIEPSIRSYLEDLNSQEGHNLYELPVKDARQLSFKIGL